MIKAEEIIGLYEDLKSQRRLWDTLWQEIADLVVPRKNAITVQVTPGSKRTAQQYTSIGTHANNLLAAAIQGNLTNSKLRWFTLKMADDELNQVQAVAVWLEKCARRIYLAIQQSNFNADIHEVYLDLGAFGTGCLFVAERELEPPAHFAGLTFKAFPVGTYAITENANGEVNTVYRHFQLSAREVTRLWGDKASENVRKTSEKSQFERIDLLHLAYPRPGISERDVSLNTPAKKLPWASVYVELKTKHLLSESGYNEFPYMVPRWTKSSGETYGRGPGDSALADIKTLNVAVRERLKAWALALGPPIKVRDRGVIGSVKMTPYAINSVKNMDDLQPIDIGSRFDVANLNEVDIKESIRQAFFVDQLQFPPKPGTPISATEAQYRYEMMQRILGPTLGRLESELLSPLINRVFRVLLRAGALPPIPDEVLVAVAENRANIDVEYQGPLATAQRAAGIEAIQSVYSILSPLVQIAPDVMDNLNHDNVARYVAETRSLPADLIRSPEEILAMRKARTQAQEEEIEKENLESGAKAAGKLVPAIKALAETAQTNA